MTTSTIPFILPGILCRNTQVVGAGIEIETEANQEDARCPACGFSSTSVHSHYQRRIADLPLNGKPVWLVLRVRRFRCRNPACLQQIFTERLPEITLAYAHRSRRLNEVLNQIGLALGGEAGSRLARQLQMPASGDTILRILRQNTFKSLGNSRVLGIDDWAFAKGRRYGTILVDLERGVPVDLLPDRTTATLAAWLKAHSGIEIITRDRFSEYTLAVSEACPAAQQVADRWHLLKNLRETLERVLRRIHERLRTLPPSTDLLPLNDTSRPRRLRPPSANEQANMEAKRRSRFQLYRMVRYLLSRGLSQRKIASLLNLHRITVRHFAEADTFPERVLSRPRASVLDSHLRYLQQRWQGGCTNARQLYREIQARGYKGSYQQVARWAHAQRQLHLSTKQAAPLPVISTFTLPAAHHLVWLFLSLPEKLSPRDKVLLTYICQDPACCQVYDLAQQFHSMLRLRSPDFLDDWLKTCTDSQFSDLREFALGLLRDLDAVRNAFIYSWSNGPVEGHICRLKMLKRQMYGRANLDLLRIRVLARSLTLAPT